MKNEEVNFYSPKFWGEVSCKVYCTFAECVLPILNGKILREVHREVVEKINDPSRRMIPYHRGYLICENDIWYSIHIQIHNLEELSNPKISIFALLPFVGFPPYVLQLHRETSMQTQLDIYTPHFFHQYADRAERFSDEASKLDDVYIQFKVYENSTKQRLEEKCMTPLHKFIGLFLAQNWFFIHSDNKKIFSTEEQKNNFIGEKWAKVASDCVIYGVTKKEDGCPFTTNFYLTALDYPKMGEDQKPIVLPLKEELWKKYMSYILK